MNFAKASMNPRRVCLAVMLALLLTLTARAQNLTA
jgi:hypothetical protein